MTLFMPIDFTLLGEKAEIEKALDFIKSEAAKENNPDGYFGYFSKGFIKKGDFIKDNEYNAECYDIRMECWEYCINAIQKAVPTLKINAQAEVIQTVTDTDYKSTINLEPGQTIEFDMWQDIYAEKIPENEAESFQQSWEYAEKINAAYSVITLSGEHDDLEKALADIRELSEKKPEKKQLPKYVVYVSPSVVNNEREEPVVKFAKQFLQGKYNDESEYMACITDFDYHDWKNSLIDIRYKLAMELKMTVKATIVLDPFLAAELNIELEPGEDEIDGWYIADYFDSEFMYTDNFEATVYSNESELQDYIKKRYN